LTPTRDKGKEENMRNRIPSKAAGAALILAALAAVQPAQTQTFSVIYTFIGGTEGATPLANLLLYQGVLYGATSGGGAHNAGTVFQVDTTTMAETVLHSFKGGPSDGAAPFAGLIRDQSGNLYGASYGGGAHLFGTVFKIPEAGGFTLMHSFKGPPSEGAGPAGTLVMDHAGNLYGTTYSGGDTEGYGTVFEITAGGDYMTGQSFSPDGALPRAGLLLVKSALYGTTFGGPARLYGGTVFEVGVTPPLYTFTGGADGSQPQASVISDGLGNLYGTASAGGTGSFGAGNGVVFEVNIATGQETVLYTFMGLDGADPAGSLVRDADGNLYGTTRLGGAFGYGTVFELDTLGNLTTLYTFTGGADGASPFAGLVLDGSGNFWGVASAGGSAAAPGGFGTVFEIAAGK
jgi:uncharacterized repeat protein (TIGR03803 family)